jgi:hypothetical protein
MIRSTSTDSLARIAFCALLVALAGCGGDGGDGDQQPPRSFESDLPDELRYREPPRDAGGEPAFGPDQADTSRMIEEADIVQVANDRLYALSRYGGLHVIDVSAPAQLQWLGSYRGSPSAEPFEMYLRDGVAFVLYGSYGRYEQRESGDGYVWVQSSELVVLDASDPSDIERLGSFSVPGAISDSRIVGDVLYLVSYQNGSCWGCTQNEPLTSVVSLDVSDPREVEQVDELMYADDDNAWGWNRRSIHVTTERMYVAGIEYGPNEPTGSSIQVIDISDPSGELTEAAVIDAEGQISSRWQMDEHEGVLRVVSQPPAWDLQKPPVVQTFRIVSSQEITPLGRAELALPRPEQLQSVRFDAERAYAITFQRTDPLFTIDLSDPGNPVQRGALEIPGFVYHMEPRGERLIGLGFDQGNVEGAVTVSLFDVSDLAVPSMLSRVNFGGDWASLPEDQDRIHKAFRVLPELGLILVPHSGWSQARCGQNRSGVQLVDYDVTGDALALRGAVPVRGEARRALVHDARLLTMSDERVESYDLADRDQPELLDGVALTRNVARMVPLASGAVARISHDYWSSRSLLLDFVGAGEVENPQPGEGELDLGELVRPSGDQCSAYVWLQDAFAMDDRLLLAYRAEQWGSPEVKASIAGLLVVDASDPEQPELLSNVDWGFADEYFWFDGFYDYGLPGTRKAVASTGDAVAILEASYGGGMSRRRLRVIDLRDPSDPGATVIELPAPGGQGGLLVDGDTVIASHYEETEDGVARFYLDRFDLSDPSDPVQLPPINVPGTVLWADFGLGRALTADLVRQPPERIAHDECFERYATYEYAWDGGGGGGTGEGGVPATDGGSVDPVRPPDAGMSGEAGATAADGGASMTGADGTADGAGADAVVLGTCSGYRQRIHLLSVGEQGAALLDTHALQDDEAVRAYAMGDDLLFATIGKGAYYRWGAIADCFGPCGYYPSEPSTLLALSGLAGDAFQAGTIEVDADSWWGWWSSTPVHAAGKHALVVGQDDVLIVDGSEPGAPEVDRSEPLGGYVQDVSTTARDAFLSLGQYGGRRIDVVRDP